MGLAYVTVRITNLSQNGQPYDADFLVETGAIDCMVPSDELCKAEVRPERKNVYELANGQPAFYSREKKILPRLSSAPQVSNRF